MNTEVAIITGRTNICRRNMCPYATAALTNVRMVRSGTVWRRVTYGKIVRGTFLSGCRAANRRTIEETTQMVTPDNQMDVQIESLYFRRPFGVCRGSGREKTSSGRTRPSRGNSDSVKDRDRGCCGGFGAGLGLGAYSSGGGSESDELGDGDGERGRCSRGDAAKCASQPFGEPVLLTLSSSSWWMRGVDCCSCREPKRSSSSSRR